MRDYTVLIGIQARSTSTRLPNKCRMNIGDTPMVQLVLDRAFECKKNIENLHKLSVNCHVMLLTPTGDPLVDEYKHKVKVIQGDEDDILSRYDQAACECQPDYICRITADCPLLPSHIISKHIVEAIFKSMDYTTNTLDPYRTAPDGFDVEVVSMRLMKHLFENATSAEDKEHVTSLLRREIPDWAEVGVLIGHVDESAVKYSVDTEDDFQLVNIHKRQVWKKIQAANRAGLRVFRF